MTHYALLSQFQPNEEWSGGESSSQGDKTAPEDIPWDAILPSKTLHHEYFNIPVFLKTNAPIEEEGYFKVESGGFLWDCPLELVEQIVNI